MAHPPMKSKYSRGPTEEDLRAQRHAARNEKACLRMARRHAELKTRPLEEQRATAERAREYQARYREKHRDELRIWEAHRRIEVYKAKHGLRAFASYLKSKRERRRKRLAKKWMKEGYPPSDNDETDTANQTTGVAEDTDGN
ncbi:hypothetical protein B0H19DRAFT_1070401 [Mycena capillaripes]|nr:hypothetical protein B0H19DRAFT_1070401 [Mycena capillaripes]